MSSIKCKNIDTNLLIQEDLEYSTRLLAKTIGQMLVECNAFRFVKGDAGLLTMYFSVDGKTKIAELNTDNFSAHLFTGHEKYNMIEYLIRILFSELMLHMEIEESTDGILEFTVMRDESKEYAEEICIEMITDEEAIRYVGVEDSNYGHSEIEEEELEEEESEEEFEEEEEIEEDED